MARPALRLLLDGRPAQIAKDGTVLPDGLERLIVDAAAVKLSDSRH